MSRCLVWVILLLLPTFSWGQEEAADSAAVDSVVPATGTAAVDSAAVNASVTDSLPTDTPAPSEGTPLDSVDDFASRYQQRQALRVTRPARLSGHDSLLAYFASERFNVRRYVDRSYHHDAGDYFRFDPSFFVLEPQLTPMRKTVQPFGLVGDRIALVSNGIQLHSMQHQVEPDGLRDMNLVPTAWDQAIYIMPGAMGQVMGDPGMVAAMVTKPEDPVDNIPSTAILGDEGSFGYSWVRGRFNRDFGHGKLIQLAVGYREADGRASGRYDDVFHYTGRVAFPLSGRSAFVGQGNFSKRDGAFAVRPEFGGRSFARDGYNRQGRVGYELLSSTGFTRYEFGYDQRRHYSSINTLYTGRYHLFGDGGYFVAERISGSSLLQMELSGSYFEYFPSTAFHSRAQADLALRWSRLNSGWRWLVQAGGRYDDEFDFLPNAAAVLLRDGPGGLIMLSAGYSERQPTLHELFLYPHQGNLYGTGTVDYVNVGNDSLDTEKTVLVSALLEWGSLARSLRLSATGGSVTDAIEWWSSQETDGEIGTHTRFRPVNRDLDFVDVSGRIDFALGNWASLLAGAAMHQIDYADGDERPYSPEYQAFGGLELHYDWRPRLVHLFAYAELAYVGPYDGYEQTDLGEEPVINVKLSIGLKDFRFHFVWQDFFNQAYYQREYQLIPGRFFYYGLTWSFLD